MSDPTIPIYVEDSYPADTDNKGFTFYTKYLPLTLYILTLPGVAIGQD
jgi:hypothetical protein